MSSPGHSQSTAQDPGGNTPRFTYLLCLLHGRNISLFLFCEIKPKPKTHKKKKKVFCSRPLSEHVAELKNYPPINWVSSLLLYVSSLASSVAFQFFPPFCAFVSLGLHLDSDEATVNAWTAALLLDTHTTVSREFLLCAF